MTPDRLKNYLTWPVVAVLLGGLATFTAISIWGPPEAKAWLYGAHGLLWTVIAWHLPAPGTGKTTVVAPATEPPATPPGDPPPN